jgi:hypothetical protein
MFAERILAIRLPALDRADPTAPRWMRHANFQRSGTVK